MIKGNRTDTAKKLKFESGPNKGWEFGLDSQPDLNVLISRSKFVFRKAGPFDLIVPIGKMQSGKILLIRESEICIQ